MYTFWVPLEWKLNVFVSDPRVPVVETGTVTDLHSSKSV